MKKRRPTIFVLAIGIAFLFVSFLAYLAMLGENHRIDDVAKALFVKTRAQNYSEAYELLTRELQETDFYDKEHFYETCFLLELSLRKKYSLLDQNSYTIKIRKGHLWLPYLRDKTIPISILLRNSKSKGLVEFFTKENEKDFVHNVMTVTREKGSWKIKSIDHATSTIADIFQQLKKEVQLDQYIQKTHDGFYVSPITVTTKGMTPLEKRRLAFIVQKVIRFLDEDETGASHGEETSVHGSKRIK